LIWIDYLFIIRENLVLASFGGQFLNCHKNSSMK
jgi:hypothetical protein